jgi:hypothetical protein
MNLEFWWNWSNTSTLQACRYTCGYCGADVSPAVGYVASGRDLPSGMWARVYICHSCSYPTALWMNGQGGLDQAPGAPFGAHVDHVSDPGVATIYDEARRATAAGAFTAAVLCCRKLLMHIAVAKGAAEGLNFTEYVDFLEKEHWTPRDSKEWVDEIRKKGNQANHKIVIASEADAHRLIGFLEMLLRFMYEFPAKVKPSKP